MNGQFYYFCLGLATLLIIWLFLYRNQGINKKQSICMTGIVVIQLLLGLFTNDQHIEYVIYLFLLIYTVCSLRYTKSALHISFFLSSFYILELLAYTITVSLVDLATQFWCIPPSLKQAFLFAAYLVLPIVTAGILFLINHAIQKFRILPYLLQGNQEHQLFLIGYCVVFVGFVIIRDLNKLPVTGMDYYYATGFLFIHYIFYFYYLSYHALKHYKLEETRAIEELLHQERSAIQEKNAFNHDYKNILLTLSVLLDENRIKDAQELLNEITDYSSTYLLNQELQQLTNIQVGYFRAALKAGIHKAAAQRIKLQLIVSEKIRYIAMPPVDFIRILSILLTNAVDAAAESEQPFIAIEVNKNKRRIEIMIKNSCLQLPDFSHIFEKNYTTKKNHQGVGLDNLLKIAKKYEQLEVQMNPSDGLVCSRLIINSKG